MTRLEVGLLARIKMLQNVVAILVALALVAVVRRFGCVQTYACTACIDVFNAIRNSHAMTAVQ